MSNKDNKKDMNNKTKIIEMISVMMDNDLRFGQIVSNVFDTIAKDGYDPFFIEDEKLIEYMSKYFTK